MYKTPNKICMSVCMYVCRGVRGVRLLRGFILGGDRGVSVLIQYLHAKVLCLLPTSQPSEEARRQRIVPREVCSMQKNSRSAAESVSVSVRCKTPVLANCKDGTIRAIVVLANQEARYF